MKQSTNTIPIEAASRLAGVSTKELRRLVRAGEIKAAPSALSVLWPRIEMTSLLAWMNARTGPRKPPEIFQPREVRGVQL